MVLKTIVKIIFLRIIVWYGDMESPLEDLSQETLPDLTLSVNSNTGRDTFKIPLLIVNAVINASQKA